MASPWQYNYPGERKPVVNTDRGYHVAVPNSKPTENNYTAYLEDSTGKRRYMWVHNIQMSFQVAGSYAQSAKFRAWYPRNFQQPTVQISGQTANQEQYAGLVEFIRDSQRKALDTPVNPFTMDDPIFTTALVIPRAGPGHPGHVHQGHALRGFINNIERTAERWVNAPEFQFTFTVVSATAGLFHTATADGSGHMQIMTKYMGEQVRNKIRKGAQVEWMADPDKPTGAPGYSKGESGPN